MAGGLVDLPGAEVGLDLHPRQQVAVRIERPLDPGVGPAAVRLVALQRPPGTPLRRATSRRRSRAASGSSIEPADVLPGGMDPQLAAGRLGDRRRQAAVVDVGVGADDQAHVGRSRSRPGPGPARAARSRPPRRSRCRRGRCPRRRRRRRRCRAGRRARAAAGAGARRPGRIRSVRGIGGAERIGGCSQTPAGAGLCSRVPGESLRIVQVTPHPWGSRHEVNEYVERLSAELAGRGPPGADRRALGVEGGGARLAERAIDRARGAARLAVRRGRAAGARGRRRGAAAARPAPAPGPGPGRRGAGAGGAARRRAVRHRPRPRALRAEPLLGARCATPSRSTSAPSTSRRSACSPPRSPGRWSRSSSGASTRAPSPRRTTGELLRRYFPGSYELIPPGADSAERGRGRRAAADRLLRRGGAGRAAALPAGAAPAPRRPRLARHGLDSAAARSRLAADLPAAARAGRGDRPGGREVAELMARHDVVCAASGGPGSGPRRDPPALAAGAVPVVSRLPDLHRAGRRRRARAAVPARRRGDDGRPDRPARRPTATSCAAAAQARPRRAGPAAAGRRSPTRSRRSTGGRRPPPRPDAGDPAVRRRIARRKLIEVDLHMHTDHSPDCATPVEVLLRDGPRPRPRRDRDHRPQRGLRGARGAARSPRRWTTSR